MKQLFRAFLRFIMLPLAFVPIGATMAIDEIVEDEPIELEEPGEPVEEAQTAFQTALKLTPEQLESLTERAVQRLEEIKDEMGLESDGKCRPDSWMDKRVKNQAVYDNDLEWRKFSYGGVFSKSNLTRGVTRRFAREMSAKVSDDMLGTTPFFGAVKRTSGTNAALARAVEEYAQIEVEKSNLPQTLREAQRSALVRNEAVVKVRYVEDSTFFVGPATVLVDETGTPVKTNSGQYIYEDDDFVSDASVEGLQRLKKDPSFQMAEGQYGYLNIPDLKQETIRHKGLEAHVLDSRSFICPLTAPCIHKADFIAQLTDQTVEALRSQYGQYEQGLAYYNARTSGEFQPKDTHGEKQTVGDSIIIKTVRVAECYLRVDADGDGFEEEVLLVLDVDEKKPIFYDYLDNHFHKRPFEVIVGIETVPNRWYGVGIIQMLWDQNLYVDMMFNRINLKDSREASVTFADEMAVKEWRGNAAIRFGTDYVYRVEPGYDNKSRPPLWRVNLNEVSELGMQLMTEQIQDMTTTFGVISAKDASASDLNNSRTATGILNMERTANTATRYTEIAQQVGLEALLSQAVVISLMNMPALALFFSKDGDTLHSLNRMEAVGIEKEVRLFLTRARSTESLVVNQQALGIAKDYHMMLEQAPKQLMFIRPLYVNQLKALEVMDADDMLPIVDEDYLANWQQQQAAMMQQAQQDNEPKEVINYKDAPPSVQAQMEQRAGLEPAGEGERMKAIEASKPQPKPAPKAA